MIFPLGFFVGFWSMFITFVAESYGTNIRATASTFIPNLRRATNIPITISVTILSSYMTIAHSTLIVGCIVLCFCLIALTSLEETFAIDLNYTE